jgi:hypothetical protein
VDLVKVAHLYACPCIPPSRPPIVLPGDTEREAERSAREARRIERLLDAPLPPPDWSRYHSTLEMDARTFSVWCDSSPRPRLEPPPEPEPPPPPAAPRPPALKLDRALFERLADANGRAIGRAIAERARTAEELASLRLELERLRGELGQLRAAREAEQLVPAPARSGNGLAAREH